MVKALRVTIHDFATLSGVIDSAGPQPFLHLPGSSETALSSVTAPAGKLGRRSSSTSAVGPADGPALSGFPLPGGPPSRQRLRQRIHQPGSFLPLPLSERTSAP